MEEEIDIKEWFVALWNKKTIIIIVTIIFAIFGIIKYGGFFKSSNPLKNKGEEIFVAESSFILGNEKKMNTTIEDNLLDNGQTVTTDSKTIMTNRVMIDDTLFSTYKDILYSKDLLDRVILELNLDITALELSKQVTLARNEDSSLLRIIVNYSDKDDIILLTNKLVQIFSNEVSEIYFLEDAKVVESANILDKEELENSNEDISKIANVEGQSGSKKKVVFVTIIGFVLSCGVIIVIELFDNTIKNETMLERLTNSKTLITLKKSDEDNLDRFKVLRVTINNCKTILITSPDVQAGKSYVSMNLAKSFAKLGKKVILIDLTKNNSELTEKDTGKGISDYLSSSDKFVEKYAIETNYKNLSVLLSGNDVNNMTELLESPKMKETLETLERLYDVIIIDSKNILDSANTLAVAKIVQYSILVCRERKTKIDDIIKSKTYIEDIGGKVIGNIFNK